jgi:integral membrane sensor domain MASE1
MHIFKRNNYYASDSCYSTDLIRIIALAILYFLFGKIAFLAELKESMVVPVFFASEGVALAFTLVFGPRMAIGVFIGQLIFALTLNPSWFVALGIASVNSLEALMAFFILRKLKFDPSIRHVKDYIILLVLVLFVLQPFSAVLSNLVLMSSSGGLLGGSGSFISSAMSWWLANCIGQLLFAPFLMILMTNAEPLAKLKINELLPAILFTALIFLKFEYNFDEFPLGLIASVPLLIWCAYTKKLMLISFTFSVCVAIATHATGQGLGPLVAYGDDAYTLLNLFIFGYFFTAQFMCTLFIELEQKRVVAQKNAQLSADRAEHRESQLLNTLNSLSLARDNETGNHILRTQHYVKIIAEQLMNLKEFSDLLTPKKIEFLFNAAPLHDLGKVGIPDEILLKPGPLSNEEWQVMKTHTIIGESVLNSVKSVIHEEDDVIAIAKNIAIGHHEKWDGTGYPYGLSGIEISIEARIMAIADMYDALLSKRVYKAQWTHDQAVAEITSRSGSHFDPLIVDAFLLEIDRFKAIAEKYKD